jgi:hypothetical protein
MKKIKTIKQMTDIDDFDKEKYGIVDESFPIQFCPICGSDHITSSGYDDSILKVHRINCYCNTCRWEFEVFILNKGRFETQIRFDQKKCKICQERKRHW